MEIHLVPKGDLQEHDVDVSCHCKPEIELLEHGYRVTHNSFDKREYAELFGINSEGGWDIFEVTDE